MKTVFLYGINGPSDHYRIAKYLFITEEDLTIRELKETALYMKDRYPSIEHVYAIDNRRGLRRELMDTIKKDSIEGCIIFRDMLQREGLEII